MLKLHSAQSQLVTRTFITNTLKHYSSDDTIGSIIVALNTAHEHYENMDKYAYASVINYAVQLLLMNETKDDAVTLLEAYGVFDEVECTHEYMCVAA